MQSDFKKTAILRERLKKKKMKREFPILDPDVFNDSGVKVSFCNANIPVTTLACIFHHRYLLEHSNFI